MRKILIATATTLGVFAAVGLPPVAAAGKRQHFALTMVGAPIGGNEDVYDVLGPGGVRGAAVEKIVKVNSTGAGGTNRVTFFDAGGTILCETKWTLGKPDANGIIPTTTTGHSIRGTGAYRHVKESFSIKGFYDAKNRRLELTLSGTRSL